MNVCWTTYALENDASSVAENGFVPVGSDAMTKASSSKSFARAMKIAGYNRPLYLAAAFIILVGVTILAMSGLPFAVRCMAAVGVIIASWFSVASFLAFHVMFDRSELLGGEWLTKHIVRSPARWIQINAGLEETTLPMHTIFPSAEGRTLDLYDPKIMTEPAVTRARGNHSTTATIANPASLPFEDGWSDLVVVPLAAHEIRDGAVRARFFHELRRVVASGGHIVVVEHLRDFIAGMAFGPGILHFYPRHEWIRLGELAGLEVSQERSISPFIRVFVYRAKPAK